VFLLTLTLFGLIGTDHVSHLLIEAIIDTGTGSSFQARAAADNAPCIIKDKGANCQPFFLLFRSFFRFFPFGQVFLTEQSVNIPFLFPPLAVQSIVFVLY